MRTGEIAMNPALWPQYIDAFQATALATAEGAQELLDEPGITGRLGDADRPNGRILITSDAALTTLVDLGDPHASIVNVVSTAHQCLDYMSALPGYSHQPTTAMIASDLAAVRQVPLDDSLTMRTAAIQPDVGEVALREAAAANLRFDPFDDLPVEQFANYLGSLPNATILVALDEQGEIRATAGAAALGREARVFLIATDPAVRGLGVGTAMTAAVLTAARSRGATRASLEATAAGQGIYRRLGFESIGNVAMFSNLR